MPDKYRRKVPDRPEKRRPKQDRYNSPPNAETWDPARVPWLPGPNADYAAWMVAAETAYREYRLIVKEYRGHWQDEKAREAYERSRNLMSYTHARAYPGNFWTGMDELEAGKTDNLEIYIRFLEIDPYLFGSGYDKAKVIRYLKWVPLTSLQQRRLQEVVLRVVDQGWRREFRSYGHLARHVQSADWLKALEKRLTDKDPNLALRARWILEACALPPPVRTLQST